MRKTTRLLTALTLTLALTGCGAHRFGGQGGSLGDGQLDLLKLLAIAGGIQSGDATPLCQTILAGQGEADPTTQGLLLAACRGLLGEMVGKQSSPFAASPVVAGSAVPAGDACESLEVACSVAQDACGWVIH